ncbi:MAG: peptidoglycan DD-metalloendopeptidase family protein, partial [Oscillospiraceae bacterium]|nr:peptidoglycan DD-metalloendopeptidase family protein [Candidatus Equicaccousia limihippi]
IAAYQKQIDEKQAVIQNTKDALKQRVRAIAMSGTGGNEAILLLRSADFGDYLTGRGLVRSASSKDRSIVEDMNAAIAEIKTSQETLNVQIAEQKSLKAELDAKNNQIKAKRAEVNEVLAKLNNEQASLEKQNDIAEAEIKRITKEIQAATGSGSGGSAKADKSIVYKGGKFAWPVPGYYGISSYYEYRWGSFHSGIDISSSGINGKPIVAAADGQVLVSGWSTGGYGNYVTINHGYMNGKNYTTLYGHMSRTACSAGQRVKRGQVIGYVGSTGWSTGPHCHFEVRVNGSTVNPLSYLR